MNRRDFETLAKALKRTKPPYDEGMALVGWYVAVETIAALAGANGNRFLKACGVNDAAP